MSSGSLKIGETKRTEYGYLPSKLRCKTLSVGSLLNENKCTQCKILKINSFNNSLLEAEVLFTPLDFKS
jgi:hypothetical protein